MESRRPRAIGRCRSRRAGTILADRERLETALDGVLENAVKATDDGDTIRVECRAEGRPLVIEVTDQGRGIGAEDLPRIFDRFTRVETDRARSNGGTGLGLSITKAIVEAHGGSIDGGERGGTWNDLPDRPRLRSARLRSRPLPSDYGMGTRATSADRGSSSSVISARWSTSTVCRLNKKVVPAPSSESTQICPDIASTSVRAM